MTVFLHQSRMLTVTTLATEWEVLMVSVFDDHFYLGRIFFYRGCLVIPKSSQSFAILLSQNCMPLSHLIFICQMTGESMLARCQTLPFSQIVVLCIGRKMP